MEEQEKVKRRTRDGCWTCRKRKKKCDGTGIPCSNCTRLGLECENQVRLVWEDDARRAGMKRRGPAGRVQNGSPKKYQNDFIVTRPRSDSSAQTGTGKGLASQAMVKQRPNDLLSNLDVAPALAHVVRYQQLSAYPRALDATESLLLDHYIQRFSREYPTCSGPSNPFLSVLIPIAMKCSMVLDSLLALSGAQRWEHGPAAIEKESLRLRQQALKGARKLLLTEDGNSHDRFSDGSTNNNHSTLSNVQGQSLDPTSQENLLCLLTSSILFLLYEKVSGETTWKPHMEFISQFFERWMTSLSIDTNQSPEVAEAIRFLHDLFVYNDLVRATTLKTKPLSNFYLTTTTATGANCSPLETAFFPSGTHERADFQRRYHFPNLIARLSSGDHSVSDEDITAWDGSMDWLPSFALGQSVKEAIAGDAASSERAIPWNDKTIISELYRTSASIYRRQILRSQQHNGEVYGVSGTADNEIVLPQLASFAHFLLSSLPEYSAYENALIWPIGISAKELTMNQVEERSNILQRLQQLQGRVNLKYYQKVQEVLLRHWAQRDSGMWTPGWLDNEDAILLG